MIPSDDGLFVRFRETGTNNGLGDDGFILELSPSTGEPIRKLLVGTVSMWAVALRSSR